ncbi:MAG TPA: hypothetical protein VK669_11150 [Candidatus Limnocylindrales bacterium]|nr:hypothetical protein [Candidatus Limnocylindrales bacterium]
MRIARWVLSVTVAVLLAVGHVTATARRGGAVFPFVAGTSWTYAGTVKWTDDRNRPRNRDVRWSSEVVEAFDHDDVAGALLRGGVWDLAWWSPQARHGTYAVVRVGTRFYLLHDHAAKSAFASLKASGLDARPADLEYSRWFDAPLEKGELHRPPDRLPRDDSMYGWWIESAEPVALDVPGLASATRTSYRLSYLTLPDEQHLTFVPGVGITSFVYVHHGTVAEAHVHLVAYRPGRAK